MANHGGAHDSLQTNADRCRLKSEDWWATFDIFIVPTGLSQIVISNLSFDILGRSERRVQKVFAEIQKELSQHTLQVKVEKSLWLVNFIYRCSEVGSSSSITSEVTRHMSSVNRRYYSLRTLFRSVILSRKCNHYQSL